MSAWTTEKARARRATGLDVCCTASVGRAPDRSRMHPRLDRVVPFYVRFEELFDAARQGERVMWGLILDHVTDAMMDTLLETSARRNRGVCCLGHLLMGRIFVDGRAKHGDRGLFVDEAFVVLMLRQIFANKRAPPHCNAAAPERQRHLDEWFVAVDTLDWLEWLERVQAHQHAPLLRDMLYKCVLPKLHLTDDAGDAAQESARHLRHVVGLLDAVNVEILPKVNDFALGRDERADCCLAALWRAIHAKFELAIPTPPPCLCALSKN